MILNIKILLAYLLYGIHLFMYSSSKQRLVIDLDVERWGKEAHIPYSSKTKRLLYLLLSRPQFRNLFYYRTGSHSRFLRMLSPPDPYVSIADDSTGIEGGDIFRTCMGDPGFCHPYGRGCILRQLTTFGVKSKNRHGERPWIGNNVDFGVNVTCIGNVRIGDNAIVAAGSVVVKDVAANAIVAGNPAKVIKYRDKDTIN